MDLTAAYSRTDDAVIVRVAGLVDGGTAPELQRVCHQSIAPGDKNMILDLTDVEYVSSAGLGTVLVAGKEISSYGGQLRICGLTPRLQRVFALAGFDSLFHFYDPRSRSVRLLKRQISWSE